MSSDNPGAPSRQNQRTATILAGLIIAVVAFQLNATMLNPAVTDMQNTLNATTAEIGRSSSFFFLFSAIFSIFVPRLSDMYGRRKLLLFALVMLIIGTLIAIWAPNILWLYVGRAIQGACGPVFALALLVLRDAYPDPQKYGTAMGIIAAINGGIAGVDVILGGWMADEYGFRSILWFTLVVSLIAVVGTIVWVPESVPSRGAKMDWLGAGLIALFVVLMTWTVGGDGFNAFPGIWTAIYGVLAVVTAIAFIAWQRKTVEPFIPRTAWGSRAIWLVPLITISTLTGVMAVVNLVVPSFSQNPTAGWGMSAFLVSVLFMAPYALIGWAVGPFAGHIAPRIGYKKVLQIGLAGSVLVMVLFALIGLSNKWLLGMSAVLLGVTYAGIVNVMLNGLGVVLSPKEAPGLLPGLNGASFGIGAGLSFTLLGQAVTSGSPTGSESHAGYQVALWLGAGITLFTLALTFLLPNRSPQGDKRLFADEGVGVV